MLRGREAATSWSVCMWGEWAHTPYGGVLHAPAKLADDLSRRFSQMIEVHKMLKLRQWDDFMILCNIMNTIILYKFIHSSHMHAAAHIQTGLAPCAPHASSILLRSRMINSQLDLWIEGGWSFMGMPSRVQFFVILEGTPWRWVPSRSTFPSAWTSALHFFNGLMGHGSCSCTWIGTDVLMGLTAEVRAAGC